MTQQSPTEPDARFGVYCLRVKLAKIELRVVVAKAVLRLWRGCGERRYIQHIPGSYRWPAVKMQHAAHGGSI